MADNKSKKTVKKVVLAYSGGLDTSIILKWLQSTYGCEVVTFTADLGQGEELEPARQKALLLGIKKENVFVEDLREEFVRDYVFPMFRANALYEGQYLLGTSIARPLIAKKQIEIAEKVGADAVAHGATGKGNDQVRFELTYYALKPDVTVIAPWREWDLTSRGKLIEFAEKHQIPIAKDKRGEAPFSVDSNLLHTSSEGKLLEDPSQDVPDYVFSRTVDPEKAPDKPTYITVDFERGDAVAVDGKKVSPAALLKQLNEFGRANGIGRLDLVENRFVGMKSRGMYETPGGTILLAAHRGIESITLDRGAAHLKDELMPKYAELVYYGFWFVPEREMLQAAIDKSQEFVTGRVKLKLYKGNTTVVGRESKYSLYDQELVTFEEGAVAYDHRDAEGFIKLNALRLRTLGQRRRKLKLD
ncbi:MAG: argininosuccinate synthase [Pseudolabrys sp.]